MYKKMRAVTRRFPILFRFCIFLLIPLACTATYAIYVLRTSLPPVTQTINSPSGEAVVIRDRNGTPHIDAADAGTAYFTIGYVHAQDRLWQLELQRRMVQGRMSELFGKESLRQDMWFRTLGLHQAARAAWPVLSTEAKASLTQYTLGINAYLSNRERLPPEFAIFGIDPQPWTEIDSLAWIKMFALTLGTNFKSELTRYVASDIFTKSQLDLLFPDYSYAPPSDQRSKVPEQTIVKDAGIFAMINFQEDLEQQLHIGAKAAGSNAWVISGSHTTSGNPLLANDPHLGLQIPSLWYALSVRGGDINVSGMSLVGLPLVIFGHNDHIAWGGTSMVADTQDLFLERPALAAHGSYEAGQELKKFSVRKEQIIVRADFPEKLHEKYLPVVLQIRATERGPIISDQFRVTDNPVSLQWTALAPGDTSYEAFYRLNFAKSWKGFNDALSLLVAPAMNLVFADVKGNIGQLSAGKIPIRRRGDGSIPMPGWDSSYGWEGYIPFDELPKSFNPSTGLIVNANNSVVDRNYKYFISRDWASPTRATRIETMLRERLDRGHRLDGKDMKEIQHDTFDSDALSARIYLLHMTPHNDEQRQALSYLERWDGDMGLDSQAAAIFQTWMHYFRELLVANQLRRSGWSADDRVKYIADIGRNIDTSTIPLILSSASVDWCQSGKASTIPCQIELQQSLGQAIEELRKQAGGSDMNRWTWGRMQTANFTHQPLSEFKVLKNIFGRNIASAGSENTVSVAGSTYKKGEGFVQNFGPAFRQIVELNEGRIRYEYVNSTGQSGNPLSPNYFDMALPFRSRKYFEFAH